MESNAVVRVSDFMQYLRENNLVIVAQGELQANAEIQRAQLLRKKCLSLNEVLQGRFFNVKSAETLRRWCVAGKFGNDGCYQLENGQFRILSAAIKKIVYGD